MRVIKVAPWGTVANLREVVAECCRALSSGSTFNTFAIASKSTPGVDGDPMALIEETRERVSAI